jgi:hypothetical protein
MNYVIGIAWNGERLRFERWVYEAWRDGTLGDPDLLSSLQRCYSFTKLY